MSKSRTELNEHGEGLCSVPMFFGYGGPAGHCNSPAFGPQTKEYLERFRYMNPAYHSPAYAPGLACYCHGGLGPKVFKDGNAWCAVFPNFVNLQESPAAFGSSADDARGRLLMQFN